MCQNFDKHSAMCGRCEARKPKQFRICNCSTKAKETYKKAEQVFKRPLFAPEGLDASLFSVDAASTPAAERLGKEMHEHLGAGIEHSIESAPGLVGVSAFEDYDSTARLK